MKRGSRKKRYWLLGGAVIFVAVEASTYVLTGPEALGRRLYYEAMARYSPACPQPTYAVIDAHSMLQLRERSQRGLRALLKEKGITIVDSVDALPSAAKTAIPSGNGGPPLLGLCGAIQYQYMLRWHGPFAFSARSGRWYGPLAAYYSTGVSVWVCGRWLRVWHASDMWA